MGHTLVCSRKNSTTHTITVVSEFSGTGIVEWLNGGTMEWIFFPRPFCSLVCVLTIILWLSFQFACNVIVSKGLVKE